VVSDIMPKATSGMEMKLVDMLVNKEEDYING
jgi:hypothetical protein